MSASRRGRACDACHSIKIKCELGSKGGGEPPCQRCLRLGKTCAVSAPVRQKDRIAELEAKLEAMTKLLQLQEIRESPIDGDEPSPGAMSPDKTAPGRSSKKRRLRESSAVDNSESIDSESANSSKTIWDLDEIIPREVQIQILQVYHDQIEPVFPFPIMKDYETLRQRHPLLLHAIIFAASKGVLSSDTQDKLGGIITKLLSPEQVRKSKKSVELVQAILITAFWYRPPKDQAQIAIIQLSNLAISIAQDLGIDKSDCRLTISASNSTEEVSAGDAWRTWNLCYLLSAGMATCMRIPHKISWNRDHDTKLTGLEYGRDSVYTDKLLCQFVRAERLCEQISLQAGLADFDTVLEVTDQITMRRIQNLITDWKTQIPSSLSCPSLKFYEHVAVMFLHECVLQTPTNKQSFAGPYVAERLSLTDFPAPVVTPDHILSLYGLRDACHAILHTIMAFEVETIMSLPTLIFTARAIYAQWLLIKLYVAATASGNTYGAFIDAQSLEIEQYLDRMIAVSEKLIALDEECIAGKMFSPGRRLKEWLGNYNRLQAEDALFTKLSSAGSTDLEFGSNAYLTPRSNDWAAYELDENVLGAEYGLGDLFGGFEVHS